MPCNSGSCLEMHLKFFRCDSVIDIANVDRPSISLCLGLGILGRVLRCQACTLLRLLLQTS